MYSLNRMKLIGTTYIANDAWPLIDKYSIMLLEHVDSPLHMVARSRNYTAYFLERPWDGVDNPRDSWLRCTVVSRYLAPHDNLLELGTKNTELLNRLAGFISDDHDVAMYWDKSSPLDTMYVEVNGTDFSVQLSRWDCSSGENWYTVAKIRAPYDRMINVLQQAGFNEQECKSLASSSVFSTEILSKEMQMYAQWKNRSTQLHKLIIEDNHTGKQVFVIDPYYLPQFRYHFTDVHAAFWIGQLEEKRIGDVRSGSIATADLELL